MLVSAVSPVKASLGIAAVDPHVTVKDVREVQPRKAELPMDVTLAGTLKEDILDPKNAAGPIEASLDPAATDTLVRDLQS